MTYCVALRLNRGLVFAADTRTSAGNALGTPANTVPSAAGRLAADSARSCAFCSSHTRTSSSGVGEAPANTCGWRRTSLS